MSEAENPATDKIADNPMTDQIKQMIGIVAEKIEASPHWGVEREGLRVFANAIMDPDPRYWDDAFAKTTKFGQIITPPIYCSYIGMKTPQGVEDPITLAFQENPTSDGIGGVREGAGAGKGSLPTIPTSLTRILNAGNEIEVYGYPALGDRIFSQAKYSDIIGRVTKDGVPMLVITVETSFSNQKGTVLCILRQSHIRR
jgi:hypothetical protein